MNKITFLIIWLFGTIQLGLHGQCETPDGTVWDQVWESCETSQSPNKARGDLHWIQYDLGSIYTLGQSHFWNANQVDALSKGVREVTIDYSLDGSDWTSLGSYEIEKGSGAMLYGGIPGPDFNNVQARYILINILSTWGNEPCVQLSEFKVVLSDVKTSSNNESEEDDDDDEEDDEVEEEEIECEVVTDVHVEIINHEEVFISWEELEVEEYVFILLEDEEFLEEFVLDEPEIFLEELDPEITYQFIIESICEEDGFAESDLMTFQTCGVHPEEEEEEEEDIQDSNTEQKARILVAPNPTSQQIQFAYTTDQATRLRIQITNIDGGIIFNELMDSSVGDNQYTLPLTNAVSGMYYLQIYNPASNQISVKPFILINE